MTHFVLYEIINDHIGLITFNRSKVRNALSKQMLFELNDILLKIDQDPSIACTIITGSGDKAFCAGADLKERKLMSDDQVMQVVKYIQEITTNIANMNMPTIAALNGSAFGGGLEIALACDLRIAAKDIQMGLTETSLAIIPGAGGTQRLPRLIGSGKAKELIFTAKRITAKEALDISLVEHITSRNQLMDKAIQLATKIANNGPIALKQAKLAINRGIEVNLETGLEIEHLSYERTLATEDRLEGLQAFQEKRKPNYKGK